MKIFIVDECWRAGSRLTTSNDASMSCTNGLRIGARISTEFLLDAMTLTVEAELVGFIDRSPRIAQRLPKLLNWFEICAFLTVNTESK